MKPKSKAKQKAKSPNVDWEGAIPQPSEGELTQLADAATRLQNIEWKIAQQEEELRQLNLIKLRIQTQDIPDMMDKWGLSEVRLKDGSRVGIKPFIRASLPTETAIAKCKDDLERDMLMARRDNGLTYLEKHGAEALIKHLMSVEFGKGKQQLANKAIKALKKLGINTHVELTVHPQTLQAWIRERIAAGKPVDMESFAVFSGNIATVEKSTS